MRIRGGEDDDSGGDPTPGEYPDPVEITYEGEGAWPAD